MANDEQLVAEDVDADDLGGDVLVADGDEGAADAAAYQVQGRQDGQRGEEQQEEIELPLRLELVTPQLRPRHLDGGLGAAGDGRRVIDDPLDDELARERGDGEIEALDAQAGDADDGADQRGHQPAGRQRDPERQVEPHRQVGGRIGPDRHEGACPTEIWPV